MRRSVQSTSSGNVVEARLGTIPQRRHDIFSSTINSSFSTAELRRTPLYDLHVERDANMTEFGGWDMPLFYKSQGIMKEHVHCREAAGLFDVSHMLGVKIKGDDRVAFAERVLPADVQALPAGHGCLTSLPNESGGLIDDCIVTNAPGGDYLYLVINAGHEEKDLPHLHAHTKGLDVEIEPVYGQGMLALQGPKAAEVLGRLIDDPSFDLEGFSFMTAKEISVKGVPCFVTRSGYTGEDGFELSIPGDRAEHVARAMLAEKEVETVGLGARDSLRLEAGMCLYGNDIDDETTPIEAGLLWTIGKRRRKEGGFVGADKILAQIKDKSLVTRKRVGVVLTKKGPPPRSHDKIYDAEGSRVVGEITSGVFGPTAKKPVAMGYVEKKYVKSGTPLKVEIRGKLRDVATAKMPFITPQYKK